MAHNMVHVDRFCHVWGLVEIAGIGPKIGIVDNPFSIAFEMQMIDGIKPDESGKQAPVCLGLGRATQETVVC